MAWNDGLVGTALNIAATDHAPLRVMAGPGTGKSFAMKRRVARLLEAGQDPARLLAVTFTRNAAASLVKDLHALGIPDCEKVRVGTLHALCFALLSKQEVFDFLGRVPRPLISFLTSGVLQFEGGVMLADVSRMGAFGPKRDCTKRIRAFEAAWARLQSEEPGWPVDVVDRQFQAALLDWLKFHEAMLIGELVPETLRFLRSNPESNVLKSFDHVIVDEYQDLNKAEQELIDLIASHGSTAIVGDLDQSIYSFRYANPEGIDTFSQSHPETHDETLDECRRCPLRVVTIADQLIRQNHPPAPVPRLRPKPGNPDGQVHIVQWANPEAEWAELANYVRKLIQDDGYSPGDILVLTPRRVLAYGIRDAIKDLAIPVHSFYQEEALESREAQRAFCVLTLLVNPDDRPALRWWLGDESPSGREGEYRRLKAHCEESGNSPRGALEDMLQGDLHIQGVNRLLQRYESLKEELEGIEGLAIPELIDKLLPAGSDECAVLREIAQLAAAEVPETAELLDSIRAHITQPEMPEEADFVRIMSLHKSKGLTSKVVIVSGCIEGLIPFINTDEPLATQAASLKEQRRLFYVALTRATEVLVLSSAASMVRSLAWQLGARVGPGFSKVATTIASRFFHELGPGAPPAKSGEDWRNAGFGQ